MDLFSLIMSYLDQYIFNPMSNWLMENSYGGPNLTNYYLFFDESKFSVLSNSNYFKTLEGVSDDINVQGICLLDFLIFITTIVIFILLFIVAVKFIVWLFKQISFITRF